MTAPSSTTPASTEARAEPTPVVCDVCRHELARHDELGLRFCQATMRAGLTRGCICRD